MRRFASFCVVLRRLCVVYASFILNLGTADTAALRLSWLKCAYRLVVLMSAMPQQFFYLINAASSVN